MNTSQIQVTTILYFGDSLTAGHELPNEQVWPHLVEQASHGKFKAINEGQGGRPTGSLPDFKLALQRHGDVFDLMVIGLGGNDARDISGLCVPNALKNIREMIALTRAARPQVPILLIGPANIRQDALGPTKPIAKERDQNLRDLNAAYEKLAPEMSCEFVSLYGVIPPASLALDGVHPDAEGNKPIAARVLEALGKIAEQKTQSS
jgi:acyl-CoA thioesterase-1